MKNKLFGLVALCLVCTMAYAGTEVGDRDYQDTVSFWNKIKTDVISEYTSAAGVTIDGVLLKDAAVSIDTLNEKTSAAGVTVDGVLLKDTAVTANALTGSGSNNLTLTPGTSANIIMPLKQSDLGSTCTTGTLAYDTGGATNELCICKTTDTWACISFTTITGPTN